MTETNFEISRGYQASSQSSRHKHFEMILLTEGNAKCEVGVSLYFLSAGHFFLIWPRHFHALEFSPDSEGFTITLLPAFLDISSLLPFSGGGCLHVAGGLPAPMLELADLLEREYRQTALFRDEVLRGLLKLFFLHLGRSVSSPFLLQSVGKHQIVQRFHALLDQKFSSYRRPADYAAALYVTTGHLNKTVKRVSGFPTTYHIQQRILREAKRLALHPARTMKHIAYELGFKNIYYFSRFFKKASGETFTEFREKSPATENYPDDISVCGNCATHPRIGH